MTTNRTRDVQRILDELLDQPADRRDVLLAEACGSDGELRAEVEAMLLHAAQLSPEFMRLPESYAITPPSVLGHIPDALVGSEVAGYQVERVIARGGMGTVFLARQRAPSRPVALKMIDAGLVSAAARERFAFESRILAYLDHPYIAKIYESGSHETSFDGGRVIHFFAMEHVPDARSITHYAIENKLGSRERLKLFICVCDAVHHGHQRGVIHRDLKPANILVGAGGRVKVIDFGVARATDSDLATTTMHTVPGQLIGTLQYMSPEQCGGDPGAIDVRSDVYALGVVLYELLCDQPPYDLKEATIIEAARIITEQAPVRPSLVKRHLRGDIEAILDTALNKDPSARYASVATLKEDICRYVNGEIISARTATVWARGVRWLARRPLLATAIGCVLIAVLATMATYVSVWFVNSRPYRVAVGEQNSAVSVTARNTRELHHWSGGTSQSVSEALLLDAPHGSGAGPQAVIGFTSRANDDRAGVLRSYSLTGRDRGQIRWQSLITVDDMPAGLNSLPDQFDVQFVRQMDIFDQVDGDEIVAVFAHNLRSPRVIRVLSRGGNLLYQAWHDGGISHLCWLAGERLLVVSGNDSSGTWKDRGVEEAVDTHPQVVFALRPELGSVGREYLSDVGEADTGGPAWYRCLRGPIERSRIKWAPFEYHFSRYDAQHYIHLRLHLHEVSPSAGTGWVVDKHGDEVAGTRFANEEYLQISGEWNSGIFYLGDLPSIVERRAGP